MIPPALEVISVYRSQHGCHGESRAAACEPAMGEGHRPESNGKHVKRNVRQASKAGNHVGRDLSIRRKWRRLRKTAGMRDLVDMTPWTRRQSNREFVRTAGVAVMGW